ncbi:sodium-translocating pyrophosphatase [Stratiformator vulcanicus]|uniref:Putative K(+)-stimulated pyrophosphate-energized sodium pump n=1 Tax=Stratiformator vulcanicus TaxID=2527980 RepID=A0A517QZF9_9PLAN|nr:sodium-translocating pyrophosphatase [Stratiformator vulcanicus]QDT37021.1 Putative K(+)-stimulated pyrophosphate-energized sodium pump [Stratiformator vulcanicus]
MDDRSIRRTAGLAVIPALFVSDVAVAQESAAWSDHATLGFGIGLALSLTGSIVALVVAFKFFRWMIGQDEGSEKIRSIAESVRIGAAAYLKRQFLVVAVYLAAMFGLLAVLSYVVGVQAPLGPFAFITGALYSTCAGWFGMTTATRASGRATHACCSSLDAGLRVAFRSGAVMGLTVVGLALLDVTAWFAALTFLTPLLGYAPNMTEIAGTLFCSVLGASSVALFARVGGGIFTKAADVGADLVGKVEQSLREDDPRNPATIADNVGDNVGDVAGMGADLYESYLGSIIAAAALGIAAFAPWPGLQAMSVLLPLLLAAGGIGCSIAGIFMVRTSEDANQRELMSALGRGVLVSSGAVILLALALVWILLVRASMGLGDEVQVLPVSLWGVFGAIVTGLVSGVVIGRWTEYSTSEVYAPTRRIADQATTGPATVIIAGIAEGMASTWVPVLVIVTAIMLAFGCCTGFAYDSAATFSFGLYGIAVAAVGMLSTLGITLATDAYGPIADNAGGNAEMSGQDHVVRERTDALDSLGNTTAATGKGFAIGSAALTAAALLATYVEQVRTGMELKFEAVAESLEAPKIGAISLGEGLFADWSNGRDNPPEPVLIPGRSIANFFDGPPRTVPLAEATIPDIIAAANVTLMNPRTLAGLFIGVMLAFLFCALTMKAVGRAAGKMVEEVRRQFKEIPGLLDGTGTPDYARCVAISTTAALREMIVPSILGVGTPIVVGLVLGVAGTMGLLAGGLTGGFSLAVMMANAGGAWDNAKKYIEAGAHGGKGTDAHKATVVGDTVGDPFKDTSGPSLNILIKLMSLVSIVFAGFVVRFSLSGL